MSTTTAPSYELRYVPVGRLVKLLIYRSDEVLHSDKLDVCRSSAREDFIDKATRIIPDLPRQQLSNYLLQIVNDLNRAPAKPDGEIDVTRLIRPEIFHTDEVSGCAIPVISMGESGPVGQWMLYLRWANGRREKIDLTDHIQTDSGRFWIHPQPTPPAITQSSGWSSQSRQFWLEDEPAPDPVGVFQELCRAVADYLDFPAESAGGTTATLALWSILSYVYPAWSAVPYLAVGGPLGSGKSQVFEVLKRIVFRPLPSANMTAPALFRTLHERGGVLLLDEAERLRDGSPEAGELRNILLSGYKRGTPAQRMESSGDGKFRTVTFDVYGPKAIACIGSLPEALASRCIRINMFRADPTSEKPRRRIDADPQRWADLRDNLHAIALEHGPTWLELADRSDVCPAMSGRDYELWQPIMAIAAWLEGLGADALLPLIQDHARQLIELNRDDTVPDADETLLKLLATSVLSSGHHVLTTNELLRRANETEPNTFKHWSSRGITSTMKRYGIITSKNNGQRTFAKVTLSQLVKIERIYGLDLGIPKESALLCGNG
ncbi:MAG: hypothetical protein HJJLKODD_00555 [Phycisphaerae bacterium]|nr:hypothetical protein [Phycisphaerae bacterium]